MKKLIFMCCLISGLVAQPVNAASIEDKKCQIAKSDFINQVRAKNQDKYEALVSEELELEAKLNTALAVDNMIEKEKQEEQTRIKANKDAIKEAKKVQRNIKCSKVEVLSDVVTQIEDNNIGSDSLPDMFNDGNAKPLTDIFTRSNIPGSYKDASGNIIPYYDVQIPYNLTCRQIGGIAEQTDSKKGNYNLTAEEVVNGLAFADSKVGSRLIQEWSVPKCKLDDKYDLVTDYNTDSKVYSAGGTKMYGIALPKGLFPDAVGSQGFYTNPWHSRLGILADVILTDGTIIHCVVIDGIGTSHSNGKGISNGWTSSSSSTAQDSVRYRLSNLNMPQYSKFFHAAACHTIEFSGNIKNFKEFYNIKPDGSGNNVAYIRIYKASLRDGGFSAVNDRTSIFSKYKIRR